MNVAPTAKIDRIAWPTDSGFVFTARTEVEYCVADGSYTKVFFSNGAQVMISYKIKIVEQLLGGLPYFRIHESYIVNLLHALRITKKDGTWLLSIQDVEMPVAKARQKALIKNYRTLHEAKMALHEQKHPPDEPAPEE